MISPPTGAYRFTVFGTSATLLVTPASVLDDARALVERELAAVDLACNRFRPDSEISVLNGSRGVGAQASGLFAEAIEAALRAARLTDGDVDPTCGAALANLGYDTQFSLITRDAPLAAPPVPAAGWRRIEWDRARAAVRLPQDVQLDLGATAKAWAADRCARLANHRLGCGVLLSLGGDIAVAGPAPTHGWRVRVTEDHAAGSDAPGQTVALSSGGPATSSVTVRAWRRGGEPVHHIVHPATGQPAQPGWRTVSVAAATCLDANTASTAAIVRGEPALPWLTRLGLPARLVRHDGLVAMTAGWPRSPLNTVPPEAA
ncbi:MAG TPA: FAD:protein FMN transferase [Streptosporangiaceae bacterium]